MKNYFEKYTLNQIHGQKYNLYRQYYVFLKKIFGVRTSKFTQQHIFEKNLNLFFFKKNNFFLKKNRPKFMLKEPL